MTTQPDAQPPAGTDLLARVARHYDRFPYPDPRFLVAPRRPDAARLTLEWDTGYGGRPCRFPPGMSIWVAGCGTVQASEVALRHPDAAVLATDVSPATLAEAAAVARAAGVADRIEFRLHELSTPLGEGARFALIDCIGVLHHLPEPELGLATLAAALAPGGVIDLMVYQRGHRRAYLDFRKALGLLLGPDAEPEGAAALARRLAAELAGSERCGAAMRAVLAPLVELAADRPSWFADTLIHPHEHTYTPLALVEQAAQAGLSFAGWVFPQLWEAAPYLQDAGLRDRLAALPPLQRGEALSLLLAEEAPFLELYLAQADAAPPAPPGDALLLAGRVEPHGPWLRRTLGRAGDGGAFAIREEEILGPEPGTDGSLLLHGPRCTSKLPPEAGLLLELIGEGSGVRELLDRARPLLPAALPAAEAQQRLLGFIRRLCGPAARLLVFRGPD